MLRFNLIRRGLLGALRALNQGVDDNHIMIDDYYILFPVHLDRTAPTWNRDLNFSKWGPNGDLILSEMGTNWGASATEMGTKSPNGD